MVFSNREFAGILDGTLLARVWRGTHVLLWAGGSSVHIWRAHGAHWRRVGALSVNEDATPEAIMALDDAAIEVGLTEPEAYTALVSAEEWARATALARTAMANETPPRWHGVSCEEICQHVERVSAILPAPSAQEVRAVGIREALDEADLPGLRHEGEYQVKLDRHGNLMAVVYADDISREYVASVAFDGLRGHNSYHLCNLARLLGARFRRDVE